MFILFLAARARAFLALLLCFLSALLYFSAFYQYNGRLTARRAAASIGASHTAARPRAGHAAPRRRHPRHPSRGEARGCTYSRSPSSKVGKSKSSTVRPRK